MLDDIDPKLLKIVALAKGGVGGEKDTAIRIVKKLCADLGLEYDDVMNATEFRKYEIPYERNNEHDIIVQILYKFATTPEHPGVRGNKRYKEFYITTTPSKYIETMQAIAVYIAAYRKERRRIITDMPLAFIHKHEIFGGHNDPDDERKQPTRAELEAARRASRLAENMDDVTLTKAIESGAENE
ncbi:MAG: hypothetical protein WC426_13455 [Sulfuriferula sp.]